MLKLLALRGAPLFIRPLAIFLEGLLVPGQNVLVLVIPTAMLALTISSVPVHLAYYQGRDADSSASAREYASALGLILAIAVPILAGTLLALDAYLGGVLVAATCMVFLIEKLSDESSRMLEFRRQFSGWFFVQILRSVWLILPILFFKFGATYQLAFLATSFGFVLIALAVFMRVTCLTPWPKLTGMRVIRANIVFLAASFLPASYRQIPRIMITRLFPDQAHIYLATAQLAQAVGLMFNVRFQIPYRKVIAQKTALFQRRRHRLMMRYLLFPALIAPLWLLISFWVSPLHMTDAQFAAFIVPLMVADALTFAILAVHMDYLQWLRREVRLLPTYLTNGALLGILLGFLQLPIVVASENIVLTASAFTLLGLFWIIVIIRLNFRLLNASRLG
ncbi:hypothetical protein [Qipengyuania huizhouensis]|uniref:hypothetical protein n=1 Tax=Qipengyuania huizhouensis TaxID=2867245 RepID=UPI001C8754D3|nr:hypothetical protein [Qipengyuania huizhouensis]MBX7460383.1 hypothetical protein [Qipengyuania huizhouensis]